MENNKIDDDYLNQLLCELNNDVQKILNNNLKINSQLTELNNSLEPVIIKNKNNLNIWNYIYNIIIKWF